MSNTDRNNLNYHLRPAKSIERRLFCELFRKFENFQPLTNYKYIGFGAKYFIDFKLFHKELGIDDMISIEANSIDALKYEFNRPYKCIDIVFGKSCDVLPRINYDRKSIVWLDYDEILYKYMLEDIRYVISKLESGSFIVMSCNRSYGEPTDDRLKNFVDEFGKYAPAGITKKELTSNNFYKVIKRMMDTIINDVLMEKNCGIVNEEEKYLYKQLIYFTYKDGASMTSIGGMIIKNKDLDKFHLCKFEDLFYVSTEDISYNIVAPNFTLKELQHINEQLPCNDISQLDVPPGIKRDQLEKFLEVYRYFPYYTESRSVI